MHWIGHGHRSNLATKMVKRGKNLSVFDSLLRAIDFTMEEILSIDHLLIFSILFSLDMNHINLQRQMILKKKRENMKKRKDTQLFMHSMNVWSIMGFVLL